MVKMDQKYILKCLDHGKNGSQVLKCLDHGKNGSQVLKCLDHGENGSKVHIKMFRSW